MVSNDIYGWTRELSLGNYHWFYIINSESVSLSRKAVFGTVCIDDVSIRSKMAFISLLDVYFLQSFSLVSVIILISILFHISAFLYEAYRTITTSPRWRGWEKTVSAHHWKCTRNNKPYVTREERPLCRIWLYNIRTQLWFPESIDFFCLLAAWPILH